MSDSHDKNKVIREDVSHQAIEGSGKSNDTDGKDSSG